MEYYFARESVYLQAMCHWFLKTPTIPEDKIFELEKITITLTSVDLK